MINVLEQHCPWIDEQQYSWQRHFSPRHRAPWYETYLDSKTVWCIDKSFFLSAYSSGFYSRHILWGTIRISEDQTHCFFWLKKSVLWSLFASWLPYLCWMCAFKTIKSFQLRVKARVHGWRIVWIWDLRRSATCEMWTAVIKK